MYTNYYSDYLKNLVVFTKYFTVNTESKLGGTNTIICK